MSVQQHQKIEKLVTKGNCEVLGASMLALPVCLNADEIMPLLERHGFADIDAMAWYPQQNILNLYRDILEGRSNVSDNLVSIGIKSVETMQLPPEINSVESMLPMMAASYAQVHRNMQPDENSWVEQIGERHYQAVLNTPYPDDIFYGYYWGMMKKYTPKGMGFRVAPAADRADRPGTVYDITWGPNV